jgi:DNA-3-methyladenine glycosylase II
MEEALVIPSLIVPRRGAIGRWRRGLVALRDSDPAIARVLQEAGPPPLLLREHGFGTLLRAIVAQQVSAASARAIWAKVEAAVTPLTPEGFLALGETGVRALGFSRQKIDYGLGLARMIVEGRLDLRRLSKLDDEAAIAELVSIKGIGRWTAEVYLLFALGRPDIWPALDIALMTAAGKLRGLEGRPTPKEATAIAEAWRPHRSTAAILCWHDYRTMP